MAVRSAALARVDGKAFLQGMEAAGRGVLRLWGLNKMGIGPTLSYKNRNNLHSKKECYNRAHFSPF